MKPIDFLKPFLGASFLALSVAACAGGGHKKTHNDHADVLTPSQAQAVIEPLYQMLSGDKEAVGRLRTNYSANWESYHANDAFHTLPDVIGFISGPLLEQVLNLNWEFKEIQVLPNNTVVVRGEATGTMATDNFLGNKVTAGKSFKIMAIDLHTIKDGQVHTSYHIEDWLGVVQQTQ